MTGSHVRGHQSGKVVLFVGKNGLPAIRHRSIKKGGQFLSRNQDRLQNRLGLDQRWPESASDRFVEGKKCGPVTYVGQLSGFTGRDVDGKIGESTLKSRGVAERSMQ